MKLEVGKTYTYKNTRKIVKGTQFKGKQSVERKVKYVGSEGDKEVFETDSGSELLVHKSDIDSTISREPIDWFTMNGKHIPIYEGESKEDAYSRAVAQHNEDIKNKQISENQKQAENADGKGMQSNDKIGKDIAKYANDTYGLKWSSSAKKLDSGLQKSLLEQYERVHKEFPEISDIVKSVTVTNGKTDMGLVQGGTKDGTLVISSDFMKYDMNNPWKVGSGLVTDYQHQFFTHELGHAIARAIGANAEFKVFNNANVSSSDLSKISEYANDNNDSEKFAEAVSDYFIHGNKANNASISVVKSARQLLDSKKK